ncbi:hypothetical protein [Maribacter sp.]|uniref:hypothetical protein n=1 Tax=Maribacter sp. TaxID=1897614 RepID=UPI0025C3C76A|nr:hypothetical protein [Maribacter sp.]
MKAKINKQNPFRIDEANKLYKKMGELNSDCVEYGIDTNGLVYFSYMNGVVKRFTRTEFIKISRL